MSFASTSRARWAAIGAACAITLGAGGVGLVRATAPEGAAAFVPITPCRLFDTRSDAAFNTGPRATPIGPDDTFTIAARGTQGECTDVPNAATGLVMNVTAVGATAATFLTLYPADAERPNASHLNPAPGAPPTPNAVSVDLDAEGEFSVYNRFGSVDVLADVVGYYTDHDHDDRYYTEPEVDALLAAAAAAGELANKVAIDDALAAVPRASNTLNLTAESFRPLHSDVEFTAGVEGAYVITDPMDRPLRAPLQLPTGTTITSLTYHYYDNSAFNDLFMRLSRRGIGVASDEVVGGTVAFSDMAVDGYRSVTVNGAWVLTGDYAYSIWAHSADWENSDDAIRVQAVEVDYTLP